QPGRHGGGREAAPPASVRQVRHLLGHGFSPGAARQRSHPAWGGQRRRAAGGIGGIVRGGTSTVSAPVSTVCSPIRGRYEVLDIVGRGGQGTVMRALDVVHQRHVALKVKALPRGGDRKAGLEEARVLFAVRPHPNLALLREDFVLEDRYYLVMDWIEGRNLRQVLNAEGTPGLPPARVPA